MHYYDMYELNTTVSVLGVPYDAQFGKIVTTVRAIDLDTGVVTKTQYNIASVTSFHTLGMTT